MAEYVCVDGPLQGHVYVTSDDRPTGGTVTIELLGIERGQAGAEARYEVVTPADGPEPGRARFISARGLYRDPALPASVAPRDPVDSLTR